MPLFDEPPLHDFPDRAIRQQLQNPRNLRDLIATLLAERVDQFDFEHVEPVDRTFLLDDWRRRESDLLFRVPFQPGSATGTLLPALVCVLLEHQSAPDPWMPLRILVYAALGKTCCGSSCPGGCCAGPEWSESRCWKRRRAARRTLSAGKR